MKAETAINKLKGRLEAYKRRTDASAAYVVETAEILNAIIDLYNGHERLTEDYAIQAETLRRREEHERLVIEILIRRTDTLYTPELVEQVMNTRDDILAATWAVERPAQEAAYRQDLYENIIRENLDWYAIADSLRLKGLADLVTEAEKRITIPRGLLADKDKAIDYIIANKLV